MTAGDTVLSGKDGMSWHVVSVDKMATHAVVVTLPAGLAVAGGAKVVMVLGGRRG